MNSLSTTASTTASSLARATEELPSAQVYRVDSMEPEGHVLKPSVDTLKTVATDHFNKFDNDRAPDPAASVSESVGTSDLSDNPKHTLSWAGCLSSLRKTMWVEKSCEKEKDTVSANATEGPPIQSKKADAGAPANNKLEAGFASTSLSLGATYGFWSSIISCFVYGSSSDGESMYKKEDVGFFSQKKRRISNTYSGSDPGADDSVFDDVCKRLVEHLNTGFPGMKNNEIDITMEHEFFKYAKSELVAKAIKDFQETYVQEIQRKLLQNGR